MIGKINYFEYISIRYRSEKYIFLTLSLYKFSHGSF